MFCEQESASGVDVWVPGFHFWVGQCSLLGVCHPMALPPETGVRPLPMATQTTQVDRLRWAQRPRSLYPIVRYIHETVQAFFHGDGPSTRCQVAEFENIGRPKVPGSGVATLCCLTSSDLELYNVYIYIY